MKPKNAATALVILLLAGSALSVGVKLAVDAARAREAGSVDHGSTGNGVVGEKPPRRVGAGGADEVPTLTGRVKAACAVPVASGRLRALLAVAAELRASGKAGDWRTALEALRQTPVKEDGAERDVLLAAWAEADPLAALAWAKAGPKEGVFARRRDAVVMEAWTRARPEEALAWLLGRQQEDGSPDWSKRMVAAIAGLEGDRERIGRVLSAIGDRGGRMWICSQLPAIFEGATPEEAAEWLRGQAGLDGMSRSYLINSAFNHFTTYEDQAGLLAGLPAADAAQFGKRLYHDLAQAQPEVALAELEKMEPGQTRNRAVDGVLGSLVDSYRAHQAVELLDRFRDGAAARVPLKPGEPLRNMDERVMVPRLVSRLAEMTPPEDTQKMLGNCLRYRDSGEVVEGMRGLLQKWRDREPAAVRDWVAGQPDLPEVLRVEYGR